MSNKRKTILIASVVAAHVASLLIMWWVLNSDDIIEPEFEKIISVKLTNTPSKPLPPINQAARDKVVAEKKAAEKKINDAKAAKIKKAKDAKKAAEKKAAKIKAANAKKNTKPKKKKPEPAQPKNNQAAKNKKAAEKKAAQKAAEKKANDAKAAKAKKARDAKKAAEKKAAKIAYKKQQAAKAAAKKQQSAWGQHVLQACQDQVRKEWERLGSFSINFNTDDKVWISITVRKDGSTFAKVEKPKAKGQALNSQAQRLVNILNSGRYKFASFPAGYAQRSRTFRWSFGAIKK